ncbi:unnamed protein product [Pleuronectes platessa]|uniref:Uncharacterized protein n=1 Tax=Pleuronectes platessa TaxID=8262 RepID=A0A9N7YTH4_PLEPL|nr:unnamed protein product [Pleuronectes platessa]
MLKPDYGVIAARGETLWRQISGSSERSDCSHSVFVICQRFPHPHRRCSSAAALTASVSIAISEGLILSLAPFFHLAAEKVFGGSGYPLMYARTRSSWHGRTCSFFIRGLCLGVTQGDARGKKRDFELFRGSEPEATLLD